MVNTNKTVDGKTVSYVIFSDGYEIYLDGKIWVRQRGKYGKPIDKAKSYEENCLAQIEELTKEPEPVVDEYQQGYDDAVLDMIESGVL